VVTGALVLSLNIAALNALPTHSACLDAVTVAHTHVFAHNMLVFVLAHAHDPLTQCHYLLCASLLHPRMQHVVAILSLLYETLQYTV
jgi:hypothetical protein